ncbi:flavocytochrome c [Desulfovibrio sp. OttesenSCG-928-C06]|nr:flavocytochrome c [Desulfovibrio sp. OttesenSCG-928-C06]
MSEHKKSGLTRRDVLTGVAVAGVAVAAAGIPFKEAAAAPAPQKWDQTVDVVVVGTGFAGLAAAIEASDAGASVLVIDKAAMIGGNSAIASGLYNCANPKLQKKLGIEDSPELHYQQTLAGGDYRGIPEKVRFYAENALSGLEWLEKMGVEFDPKVFAAVGATYPRSHAPLNNGRGGAIISALKKQADARKITVKMNCALTAVIRDKCIEGEVLGVEVKDGKRVKFIKATRGVVLATGGFGADVSMRSKYAPQYDKDLPTTNVPWATGEAITYAQDVGADVSGMDYIQLLVACNYFTKKYGDLANLGIESAIFLNLDGKRYVAEDARRDILAGSTMNQREKVFIWLADDLAGKRYSLERIQQAVDKGLCFTAPTLEELAKLLENKMKIPAAEILASVKHYNQMVAAGVDKDFGKKKVNLKPLEKGPFWASPTQAGVHHTMGGLCTKTDTAQVIDRHGEIVPRLYAAGEVTGGIHGTNRLGGNATSDCVVFGRLAGQKVAKEKPKA